MRAADVLGPGGPLASHHDGYEQRPSQLAMAEAVEDVLERDGVLLVEAGTGTGKTLAYLAPAILSGRKVVISTGTRNLQDQIMEHDLPLLERMLETPADAACMKGLANYLCLRRFEELRASPEAAAGGSVMRQLPVVERWRETTHGGDKSELDALPEDAPIWARVTSGTDTRIGPRCDYYEQCFVTRARRRAEEARVVVVNHHLFFADLAMRGPHGGGILPDYDVVVFDEAHQIEDVATQFFGVQVSVTRLEKLARDAERILGAGESAAARRLVDGVLGRAGDFFRTLPRPEGPESSRAPLPPEAFDEGLTRALHELDTALEALAEHCRGRMAEAEAMAQLAKRTDRIRDDLATVAEARDPSHIAWTRSGAQGRRALPSIGVSPVDVSAIVREEVLFRTPAVVLTSATLSTGGNFDFIERRLGIDPEIAARELILPSSFDFGSQAALYAPPDVPDPRETAWLDEAAERILSLVELTAGGAFVLCTSIRAMHAFADRCADRLELPVMVQGEAPKANLLARFREAGNAVLFATASFWEGVDVPGEALRLVVIDKLPFDVPSDPLVAARCERVQEQGESPFMRYLVPSAALTLKQGFGRLIRGRRDRGVVAILDSRIRRKGYGKVFLRSLPEARRCDTIDDVRAFWREVGGEEQRCAE